MCLFRGQFCAAMLAAHAVLSIAYDILIETIALNNFLKSNLELHSKLCNFKHYFVIFNNVKKSFIRLLFSHLFHIL